MVSGIRIGWWFHCCLAVASWIALIIPNESLIVLLFFEFSTNKMSIESGERTFYYMTRESLCFLAMTESKYPKRTGFLYLDEVCDLFLQELVKEFGNNVSRMDSDWMNWKRHGIWIDHSPSVCCLCIMFSVFSIRIAFVVALRNRSNRPTVSFHQLRSPHSTKAEGISGRTSTTIKAERWFERDSINYEEEHHGYFGPGREIG